MLDINITGDVQLAPSPTGSGKVLTLVSGGNFFRYVMQEELALALGTDMMLPFNELVKRIEERAASSDLVVVEQEAPNGVVDLSKVRDLRSDGN